MRTFIDLNPEEFKQLKKLMKQKGREIAEKDDREGKFADDDFVDRLVDGYVDTYEKFGIEADDCVDTFWFAIMDAYDRFLD